MHAHLCNSFDSIRVQGCTAIRGGMKGWSRASGTVFIKLRYIEKYRVHLSSSSSPAPAAKSAISIESAFGYLNYANREAFGELEIK